MYCTTGLGDSNGLCYTKINLNLPAALLRHIRGLFLKKLGAARHALPFRVTSSCAEF